MLMSRSAPSRTGPFTLRMMRRVWSSKNLTRTCVTCTQQVECEQPRIWTGSVLPDWVEGQIPPRHGTAEQRMAVLALVPPHSVPVRHIA